MKKFIFLVVPLVLLACADNYNAHNKNWKGLFVTVTPTITAIGDQKPDAAYATYCMFVNKGPTIRYDITVTPNSNTQDTSKVKVELYTSKMVLEPQSYNGIKYGSVLVADQSTSASQGMPMEYINSGETVSSNAIYFDGENNFGGQEMEDAFENLPEGQKSFRFESWITFYVKESNQGQRSDWGAPEAFVGEIFIIPENSMCPNTVLEG